MIQNRFYRVNGAKWEARFFRKGEVFPDTEMEAPKQGVWARQASHGWDSAYFVGASWRSVNMDLDVRFLPEPK